MITSQGFQIALANIPYAQYLGIGFDSERQLFTLGYRDDLVGNANLKAIHGGVVGGFLENAAMLWVGMSQDQRTTPKPVDFSVDFLRPAQGERLWAQCEVVRQGRRLAAAQLRCFADDPERLIATGRGHFLLEAQAEVL